ncbi:MAG: pyridoxal-dependent decarboxylase [Caulobacteraceae bacterium]
MTRTPSDTCLDPQDWTALRTQGHRMLDDMFDHLETLRDRPVWRPQSDAAKARLHTSLPSAGTDLAEVHASFMQDVLPYSSGNSHPGFMGWVQGGGTPVGMLAELLAAGLNANLGGRDHMPIEVERQVAEWMRQVFGFPPGASGLFVTGTSMANFMAVLIARTHALGGDVRAKGVVASKPNLVAYAGRTAHGCVARAMDMAGLGSDALRLIETDEHDRIDCAALAEAISRDRRAGFKPFMVVGTAGSVDTGAIDPLSALADIAAREGLWFHIDGAFGALGMLAADIAPRLAGIERADSLAFDFHKWGQVPYDAGFLLVRDGGLHRQTFAHGGAYLQRGKRGMAAGDWWPCDYGPDLSRGFRALKTWFTLKTYGLDAIGASISRTCELARALAQLVEQSPELELLAPVNLNIVCFGLRRPDSDDLIPGIVADLHEAGRVAPSTTTVRGRLAIRAAIVNHRTEAEDIEALVTSTLALVRSAGLRLAS